MNRRRGAATVLAGLMAVGLVTGCGGDTAKRDTSPRTQPAADGKPSAPQPAPRAQAQPGDTGTVTEPARIAVPKIGVDATVVGVGLKPDGAMETPAYDANQAGWYDEGPRPGAVGPAVVAGHVDSRRGPDVFARLDELTKGDQIVVTDRSARRHTFRVERLERYDKEALAYEEIWGRTPGPTLRLITCSGRYDRAAGGYQGNLVVYAGR